MLRPLARVHALLAGFVLTTSTGCYHMYSQPYGYSGAPAGATYPGTMQYGAPIQTLTPGQPYTPGTTYQAVPQGGNPTYQNSNGGLQPIPDNSAPTYNNQPGTANPTSNPNPATPDPYFNTYSPPQSGMNSVPATAFNTQAPLNRPTANLREVRSVPIDYVPEVNPTVSPASAAVSSKQDMIAPSPAPALLPVQAAAPAAATESPDVFAPPVMSPPPAKAASPFAGTPANLPPMEATPAGAQSLWEVETKKVVTADTSPFGQDAKFQWLRGVVSKDPASGVWSIIYNDQPATEDKFAGHLSLAASPKLDGLKEGDVVEIRGELDNVVQDQQGKPVYVVTGLTKPFETHK